MKTVHAAVVSSLVGALSLGAVPQTPPRGVVRGRVVAAESGAPLRKVRIALTRDGDKPDEPVYTNADGEFEIVRVSPGRYTVTAVKTGFVTARFGARSQLDPATHIAVASGTTIGDVNFALVRGGAITGRVVDDVGDPVYRANATVGLIVPVDGRTEFQRVHQERTDDRGEYRIGGLEAGDYVLAVSGGPEAPNLTNMYYPGVKPLTEARTLRVRSGDVTSASDVSVVTAVRAQQAESGGGVSSATRALSSASIRGRVVTTDSRLLRQTVVRAIGSNTGMQRGAMTDSEGRFELENLIADTYTITINRNGHLTVDSTARHPVPGKRVTLRDGEALERVDVLVARSPVIAGQVTDEDGEPIEAAEVNALQLLSVNGRQQLIPVSLATSTDCLGQFRLSVLRPGQYAISVTPASQGAMWLPGYPTTFFPGTVSVTEAQLVEVDIGRDAENVVVRLSPGRTARITGTVISADGHPFGGSLILFNSQRSGGIASLPRIVDVERDASFDIPNVSPGEYVIQPLVFTGDGNGQFGWQYVTVGTDDVKGVTVRLSKGSTVAGRIDIDDDGSSPRPGAFSIAPFPADFDRAPIVENGYRSRMKTDGTFEMPGVFGPTRLVLDAPGGWMIKSIRSGATDLTDRPLMASKPNQSLDDLEIVVTNRSASLSGAVVDARGRAVTEYTVIAFATDSDRWYSQSRFLKFATPEPDGSFELRGLPTAEYFVAAVEPMLATPGSGQWQDPAFLAQLARRAVRVTLTEGQPSTLTLTIAR
jgi:hypothetical protein